MQTSPNIYFFGGKGGVGKSSLACAFATSKAKANYKTLLVSSDPAHNLGDIFNQPIGRQITHLTHKLYGLEIDAASEAKQYINSVKQHLSQNIHTPLREEIDRQIDIAQSAPGTDEAALFDRITSIILDEQAKFDCIVFDTAPTGHTLRLLSLPELLGVWIDGLVGRREKAQDTLGLLNETIAPDPMHTILLARQQRYRHVREVLLDPKKTAFYFVVIPEYLSIMETERTLQILRQYQLDITSIIVNKILPEQNLDPFWQQRKQQEKNYLNQINTVFEQQEIIYISLLSEDIITTNTLDRLAQYFY